MAAKDLPKFHYKFLTHQVRKTIIILKSQILMVQNAAEMKEDLKSVNPG